MKEQYPTYKKGELQAIEKKLSPKNKVILLDFAKQCLINAGESKVTKIKRHIIQFYDVVEKNLYDITKEDVDGFLVVLNQSNRKPYTRKEIKVYLKKFLKWYYKDLEMIENIKAENITELNSEKYNDNSLITEEDMEKLLRHAESYKEKAFLFLIFETGARPQELINLKWGDIKFDDNTADITLYSGKTRKSRIFPVHKAKDYLWDWKQNYSYPDVKNSDWVFPSRWRERNITSVGLNKMLRRLSKEAGLNKDIWNYLFRHTRATRLYEELPQQIVEKLMGHKNMAQIYAHISSKKAKEKMLNQIYKIEKQTPLDKKELKELEKEIKFIKSIILNPEGQDKKVFENFEKGKKVGEIIVQYKGDVEKLAQV